MLVVTWQQGKRLHAFKVARAGIHCLCPVIGIRICEQANRQADREQAGGRLVELCRCRFQKTPYAWLTLPHTPLEPSVGDQVLAFHVLRIDQDVQHHDRI